jgi:ABC-2 type transport system permease protein
MMALLRKEWREQWRTRKVLAVTAVLFVFGSLGPVSIKYMPLLLERMPGVPEGLAEVMPEPDLAMAVGEFAQNVTQFGLILAVLVPMSAVVGEKISGTAAMVLSKPVSRWKFISAKFLAHAAVFLAGVALACLGGYYYLGVLFEWRPPGGFLLLSASLLLYLAVFVSLTLFASTVARSQLAALGIAVGLVINYGFLGVLPPLVPYLPGSLVAWGGARALGAQVAHPWRALVFSLLTMFCAWICACLTFRRQELE